MNYEKGSEWRKWDMHVHTPETKLNNQYRKQGDINVWDLFCEKIELSDVSVFGITDYFSIQNYISFIQKFTKKNPNTIKTFFPNIEFRIDSKNRKSEHIQFHVIFNNEELIINKIEDFLTRLELVSTDDGNLTNKYCTNNDLMEIGFDKAMVKLADLSKLLKSNFTTNEYILVGVANGYGSLRPNSTNDGRGNEYAKELDKIIDVFFGNSGNTNFFLNIDLGREQHNLPPKPVLTGCDAHSFNDLDNKLGKFYEKLGNKSKIIDRSEVTWIKADPTFEGLKQIIYEPKERVYIGEKPPILSKVENNRTNYLKSLNVNQDNVNHVGDIWFKDISIPFNKELVAIIGNKGSGKSGIADILGLVGDTHTDKKHFSFLHKDKFLKRKLADKFKAQIVWMSNGKSEEVLLGSDLKTEKPESVRFIPQNYFEELTNEIEVNKFQHVLENIIFNYIPNAEKFSTSNFKELEIYKTENVNRKIQIQKNKIQNINNNIIELEKKKHPEYLEKINGLISKKQIEIDEQVKLLQELPDITNPNTGDQNEVQNTNIAKHNVKLEQFKKLLKEKEKEKSIITSKIEGLKQFKEKIKQQEQSLNDFIKNNSAKAQDYNLDINNLLKIVTNYSSIENLFEEEITALEKINIHFESVESIQGKKQEDNNQSIVYKIQILINKIKIETDKLTGEEKTFQQNEQRKKLISEKIQLLTGETENPTNETLNFYLNEKKFIDNELANLLDTKRNSRIKESLDIFNKKQEIIELYNAFKQSVDNKIIQNKDLLEDYDIKIDSSFALSARFYDDFLSYINQGRRGCFYGLDEGKNKIKTMLEDNGFSSEENVHKLLKEIIISLEENGSFIHEQVNRDKLDEFYNFVFSLDYIKPKYELKLGGKILSQLSPGERGALLLIFYLMIDKEEIPLVIDQPEDNLDNESVFNMLSKFIKKAKKKRQIIMVTHNPNLAVGADAEQIIHVNIDKMNKNKFSFTSGSIENPVINKKIVQILEGTKPAFDKRKLKYQGN